jgi:single-strand DNA-binding protein
MEKRSFNRVELLGHVGMDAKVFETEGRKVAKFTFATKETYHDKTGKIQEETTWHNIYAWEGQNINFDDIKKGRYLYISGSIRNSRYQTADGEKRYFVEVRALKILPGEEIEKPAASAV